MTTIEQYEEYLVSWIKAEVTAAQCAGVIVGLSGGIDSAVVALLAKKAFPDNYLTVIMPCQSDPVDEQFAQQLVEKHSLNTLTIDLSETYQTLLKNLPLNQHQLAAANIKPRLRMTTLYSLAQANRYLVLGTDNADEWHVGYFTKYGDGGVDLVPLVHLLKQDVRALAKLLGVNDVIIDRLPTAGLWENQTDEAEMGFSYQQLDAFLLGEPVAESIKTRIDYLHKISEHKRNLAKSPLKPFRNLPNYHK
ncbi:NH(3)-dependent NAD(+) synthetase [Spiroplasma syrphidicola EA-1]|uniref:NH(3)-dependent NAD(+) synthetase n=1 Tax=Spiroplasma syrphidicola EA-1 TaxID=1276229 RepID=R4ULV6_9MOLU|nr:NAD(+) synthase [Spiroplasma syrphidicola]AGM26196.1 NH(3)-dependent NAD(+) synthetase [Spiroplasma syrphidicola EA-1]